MSSGVGHVKAGSARRRARVRLMTPDQLERHKAGMKRLGAYFVGARKGMER